jgi:hypothetical protein
MSEREGPRFAAIGHCVPDAAMIRGAVRRVHPAASFVEVSDESGVTALRGTGAILLVNRVLDGDFEAEDGIALIRRELAADPSGVFVLVSNYPEAQAAAVALGARRGFGKSQLHAPETAETLRAIAAS